MPLPTPFHERTSPLCVSQEWRNWSGYLGAVTYAYSHEREYYAIRNAAALIDVSPLYKYEIAGPDAARLVNRIIPRDIEKCAVGQVFYTPWCDEMGKMIDDGTVSRLAEDRFRLTSAEPNLLWFDDCGYGMEVQITDVSRELAALSLQGPRSREILCRLAPGAGIESLKFFRLLETRLGGVPVTVSRTGYTGDLGYEIWVPVGEALKVWDVLFETGKGYGLLPVGLDAMDISRIEAGLLLIDVDYIPSRKALIEQRKSSPFEAGLGWTVKLDKPDFVGKRALAEEKESGSVWALVGLEADWEHLESLYAKVDLTPQVVGRASRQAVPIYAGRKQVGQATSLVFSPILKRFIALASVHAGYAKPGARLELEVTVEFMRKRVWARIVKPPFYNPPHKRA